MLANTPKHLQVKPLQGVDYIGSSMEFWGSPYITALMVVLMNIVLVKRLTYATRIEK